MRQAQSQMRAPTERRESTESQQQTPRLGISDFTFLQVLGKGSFGKVGMTSWRMSSVMQSQMNHQGAGRGKSSPILVYVASTGDAGETKHQRSGFCGQGVEEGHNSAGRWRGVHHDWEEGAVAGLLSPLPHTAVLLLPDAGQYGGICLTIINLSLFQINRGNVLISDQIPSALLR